MLIQLFCCAFSKIERIHSHVGKGEKEDRRKRGEKEERGERERGRGKGERGRKRKGKREIQTIIGNKRVEKRKSEERGRQFAQIFFKQAS